MESELDTFTWILIGVAPILGIPAVLGIRRILKICALDEGLSQTEAEAENCPPAEREEG